MNNARERSDALVTLLSQEQHAMADFLLALAEFDGEKVWQQLGHASLFSYLRAELKLSAGAAQYRKTAAELIRRFPSVEEALRRGQLCLSSVIELAKVLTPENEAEVLPRFHGLSARDAAAVAVSIVPAENPPEREVVTMLRRVAPPALAASLALEAPTASAPQPDAFRTSEMEPTGSPAQAAVTAPAPSSPARCLAPPPPPISTDPLSADLARLHVNVSKGFLDKLGQARDALAHVMPGASAADILEAGLDLLLKQRDQRRATGRKPATKKRPADPDTITADVRRAVWKRDQGRCQFPLEGGGVCGSTYRLELDHVHAKALGGQPTIEGLRVACRPHNQHAARVAFGDAFIDGKIRDRRSRDRPAARNGRPGSGERP